MLTKDKGLKEEEEEEEVRENSYLLRPKGSRWQGRLGVSLRWGSFGTSALKVLPATGFSRHPLPVPINPLARRGGLWRRQRDGRAQPPFPGSWDWPLPRVNPEPTLHHRVRNPLRGERRARRARRGGEEEARTRYNWRRCRSMLRGISSEAGRYVPHLCKRGPLPGGGEKKRGESVANTRERGAPPLPDFLATIISSW